MRSNSRTVDMDKLADDPRIGSLLVRLMMVSNDIALANESHQMWHETKMRKRVRRRQEARRYAVRMIISHINEGMRLIQEINQDADFQALLAKSRPKTRDAFAELLLYGQSQEYKDLIVRIRNNIGFHYSANCVAKALKDWTKARPGEFQSVSMGTDRIDWDFAPGDTISQQVVVRDIFKIKPGGDDTKEADEIMDKIFKRATVFSDFCGHFVREVAPR
jgi:hypothetical protein